jgi:SAM-dependent methyltransferase
MNLIKRAIRSFVRRLKNILNTKPYPRMKPNDATKLHLGCGNIHLPGFCNVDILKTPAVDVISDISKLDNFRNESIELIYACHVLEHFSHTDSVNVLTRWFEVLEPGGELRISVPDIDRIVKIYSDNWEHFQTPGHSPWIGLLYGGQGDPYDFHKTGFNFCWLKYIMEKIGYVSISEYPHEPHFVENIIDASQAREPFGEFVSLNLIAKKPNNQ